jgi:hypothetical protein
LIPARESLFSDIPAGSWKIANLFYSVYYLLFSPFYYVEEVPDALDQAITVIFTINTSLYELGGVTVLLPGNNGYSKHKYLPLRVRRCKGTTARLVN